MNNLPNNMTGAVSIPAVPSISYQINSGGLWSPGLTNYPSAYITNSSLQQLPIVTLNNSSNQEIVRLNKDGSVTWANDINVDEAAIAFEHSLKIGSERAASITKGVKQRMRDTVFEEIIEIAKVKGTLTVDELTYMLHSAKILDKLKGGYE